MNFFDHSKLLLSADAQVVTYLNKTREKNTYLLSEIGELGNSEQTSEVVNRLKYTRDILLYMISSNKKEGNDFS